MRRLTAQDFHPGLLALYDWVRARQTQSARFSRSRRCVRGGRVECGGDPGIAEPQLRARHAGGVHRPGHRGRVHHLSLAQRPWPGARLSGASGQGHRCGARRGGGARKPWFESVYRRRGAARGQSGFRRVGTGWPEFGRWVSGNDEKGRALQAQVDPTKLMNDFFAAVEFLMSRERTTGKVGITGFCYGGGVANAAAVAYPELAAAVPFYGRQPTDAEVARLRAPLGAGGTTCLGGAPRRDWAGDSSSSSGAHQCAFPVA